MPRTPFIGREREKQLYQTFLQEDSPWVLAITGLGGCGKSMLLYHFEKQTPPDVVVIKYNFAAEALHVDPTTRKPLALDPLTIIETLASQMRFQCDAQQYATFLQTMRESRRQLAEQRTQIIQSVRVGNEAKMEGGRFQINVDEIDEAVRKAHYHIQELAADAFYALVDTFILNRLVILLDSCEWLNEQVNSEVGPWVINEFLIRLHDRMQQQYKHCHVVGASSMQFRIHTVSEQDREDLELAELDEEAVTEHLENVGIQDAKLRQGIYEMTHGNATCVAIICDLWQELKEKPTNSTQLSDFRRRFSERAVKNFVDKHILDERLQAPFDELTRYSVLLRSFTYPLLKKVFSDRPELQSIDSQARRYFTRFISYLYVKELGNYRYTLIALLREVLAESIRKQEPEKWERYHQRALEYLQTEIKLSQAPVLSPDWHYHSLACKLTYDDEQDLLHWQEVFREAKGRGEAFDAMLEAANDKALMFTSVGHVGETS